MAISTEMALSMLLSSADNLDTENKSAAEEQSTNISRHKNNSAKSGKKIATQATMPYTPTVALIVPIDAVMVVSASLKALPAIGTVEPKTNFAVFVVSVSADEATVV